MFVEILCRCETSFAHASLCLKYHALDRTSTIIQSLKIGSEKCANKYQQLFSIKNYFPNYKFCFAELTVHTLISLITVEIGINVEGGQKLQNQ